MSHPRLVDVGDRVLLLEWEPVVSVDVNRRVLGVAEALRHAAVPGVSDVWPAFQSIAVAYDPALTSRDTVATAVSHAAAAAPSMQGREVEIPVLYGGADGPDLGDVAAASGLSEDAVVAAHAESVYHAFLVGFMPGFAYLGPLPGSLTAARRATPRLRVPAGSVGVAGRQTGVYPRMSPGGWALIGRTNVPMFDPTGPAPSRIQPGDRVRFIPTAALHEAAPAAPPPDTVPRTSALRVLQPGLLTTVQDAGRHGWHHQGVTSAGAMDQSARAEANAAVGNGPEAAVIEATLAGLALRAEHRVVAAVAGADLSCAIDGREVPLGVPHVLPPGAELRLRERRRGARAYVAVAGGVDVPLVLGSRSTDIAAGFGGVEGRVLRAGDGLAVGAAPSGGLVGAPPERLARGGRPGEVIRLRVLAGPHADWCHPDALDRLTEAAYRISPHSNRMGYRLSGGVAIGRPDRGEMISQGTTHGALQVPTDGQPILLMADRQVTGGYPILASVIAADLPLAAQLAPGDGVRFEVCSWADARAAAGTGR